MRADHRWRHWGSVVDPAGEKGGRRERAGAGVEQGLWNTSAGDIVTVPHCSPQGQGLQ